MELFKRKSSDYSRKDESTDSMAEEQGEAGELDSSSKNNIDSSSHGGNKAESEPEQQQQEDVKYIDVEEQNHNKENYDHEAEMDTHTNTHLSPQHLRDMSPLLPYVAKGA